VLPLVNDNQWTLTYVNNVNASMLFLPLVLLLEGSTVIQYAHQVPTRLTFGDHPSQSPIISLEPPKHNQSIVEA
jgi:hypothetical protein